MKVSTLIDRAKEKSGIDSDRKLAMCLSVSHTAVGKWRSGKDLPKTAYAHKLAQMAGLDPAQVIIDIQIQGEKKPEVRQTLERLKSALLAAILIVPQCILCQIQGDTKKPQFA